MTCLPSDVGRSPPRAGRSIPGRRPNPTKAVAIAAPVFPTDRKASVSPFLRVLIPTHKEVCRFPRTDKAACSSIGTVSGAWMISKTPSESWLMSSRLSIALSPMSVTSIPAFRAISAPATVLVGASSPPIASIAIAIFPSYMIVSCALKYLKCLREILSL